MKRKLLIIHRDMACGGIEKSLINFIRLFKDDFDISLLLLQQEGEMLSQLPKSIKLLTLSKKYQNLTKKRRDFYESRSPFGCHR